LGATGGGGGGGVHDERRGGCNEGAQWDVQGSHREGV
jgi:hypothetical protein